MLLTLSKFFESNDKMATLSKLDDYFVTVPVSYSRKSRKIQFKNTFFQFKKQFLQAEIANYLTF